MFVWDLTTFVKGILIYDSMECRVRAEGKTSDDLSTVEGGGF